MPCSLGGRSGRVSKRPLIALLALSLVAAGPLAAQDEEQKELGWFDQAELSLVSTSGNSESQTLALRNTLTRVWERAVFKVTAGALRAESTDTTRTAIGTSPADARLVESSVTSTTAERYNLDLRYEHQINDRLYWYGAAGWLRNEPAGVKSRSSVAGGIGNIWFDRDTARFRTDYGLTYTDESLVVAGPGGDDAFAGFRLAWDYWRKLTGTTAYGNDLAVDVNLDDTTDLRALMVNSLSVKISDGMALKLSHEAQLDNQPALIAVPIFDAGGAPIGERLLIEADELDTTLSVALVVTI